MKQLRRVVALILVACLALAVGIALGGGPLQGDEESEAAAVAGDRDDLAAQVEALEEARVLDEAVTQGAADELLGSRLTGRTVTMLVLPETPTAVVDELRSSLQTAGASVPVTAYLAPDLLDPAKKTYVDSVATNSVSSVPALAVGVTGETYDRIGALLARAYVGPADGTEFDETARNIDAELRGAQLVELESEPGRRGSLALLVGPVDVDDAATVAARQVIASALVRALVNRSDGFLLAQPETTDDASEPLAAVLAADATLASDPSWSTVNVVEGTAAQITAAYALAAAVNAKGGSFGVVEGAAVLPPGLGAPTD